MFNNWILSSFVSCYFLPIDWNSFFHFMFQISKNSSFCLMFTLFQFQKDIRFFTTSKSYVNSVFYSSPLILLFILFPLHFSLLVTFTFSQSSFFFRFLFIFFFSILLPAFSSYFSNIRVFLSTLLHLLFNVILLPFSFGCFPCYKSISNNQYIFSIDLKTSWNLIIPFTL